MKNFFFIAVLCSIFSGSSLTAISQTHINAANLTDGNAGSKSYKFIEGIEIKAENVPAVQPVTVEPNSKSTVTPKIGQGPIIPSEIEHISSLQFKYAQLLDCNVEDVKNIPLFNFIEEWWETRYRYGGTSKKGIDCSALSSLLMNSVFAIKLPRTAREQYGIATKLDKEGLTEGDLVFFNTSRGVSHVGIYLTDGYFVHASRNNGVTISNLDKDPYYISRFIGAGRVIGNSNTTAVNQPQ